jgi:hypothetical protein
MEEGLEQNKPEAIKGLIELIPALGERRERFEVTDNIKPRMNIRNYSKILSAA